MKKSTGLTPSFKKSARVTSESPDQDLENIEGRSSSARESAKKALFFGGQEENRAATEKKAAKSPEKIAAGPRRPASAARMELGSQAVVSPTGSSSRTSKPVLEFGNVDMTKPRSPPKTRKQPPIDFSQRASYRNRTPESSDDEQETVSKAAAAATTTSRTTGRPARLATTKPKIHKDEELSFEEELNSEESEEEKVSKESDEGEREAPEEHRIDVVKEEYNGQRLEQKDEGEKKEVMRRPRRVTKRSDTDLKCPLCKYTTRVLSSWVFHLKDKHVTTPTLAGYALRCGCGHESYSYKHCITCEKISGVVVVRRDVSKKKCVNGNCSSYPKSIRGYYKHLKRQHGSKPAELGISFFCESCDCEVDSEKQARMHTSKCGGTKFSIVSTREEENGGKIRGEAVESDDISSEEEEYGDEREGGEVEYESEESDEEEYDEGSDGGEEQSEDDLDNVAQFENLSLDGDEDKVEEFEEMPPLLEDIEVEEIGERVMKMEEKEKEEEEKGDHPLRGLAPSLLSLIQRFFSNRKGKNGEKDQPLIVPHYVSTIRLICENALLKEDVYDWMEDEAVARLLEWMEAEEPCEDLFDWLEFIVDITQDISPDESIELSELTSALRAETEAAEPDNE